MQRVSANGSYEVDPRTVVPWPMNSCHRILPTHDSTTVQRRDKYNAVPWLQLIAPLTFQFPVSVVDKHKDPRSPVQSQQLLP